MSDLKEIILNNSTETLERILSPFIEEQFPMFVRSDYRKLVLFIKAYYEWLEQKGNPGYILSNMNTVGDVDQNLEEFYSHFKNTYLEGFPDFVAINDFKQKPNKKTLLKKIREFYGNKGTESAYEFVFRVLYNSDVDFYYPKEDILKASDGKWIEPRSIKTTSTNGNALLGAKGGTIVQANGSVDFSSAFIESVVQYTFNGLPITEFFISNLVGDLFVPEVGVVIRDRNGNEYEETTYSVLGEFYVELAGKGYQIGDVVSVSDNNGRGFLAAVEQIGLAGSIKKIGIKNSGINYKQDIVLNVISPTGRQSAKVVGLKSAVTTYPGYFYGNRGKASSNKKIQDGHYYQDFSYELKSEVSFDSYYSILKTIAHPAGMRMFGSILVKRNLQNNPVSSSDGTFYERAVVGKYTPYKFSTYVDLRNNENYQEGYWLGSTGDLYPLGYNPYIGSTTEVGPNGQTTSDGTEFVGTSLGYTYCYVPELGATSHNPIGAPLGGITAWLLGREDSYLPSKINGLVLWLKPENIGVCGSVANGASMDVWTDASQYQNHAVPPTWDRWGVTAYSGVTIDKLRPTLVIDDNGVAGATGIEFTTSQHTSMLVGPWTYWTDGGVTLGGLGITFGPGSSGEKMLNAPHFYLKNGLTLSGEMDMFLVFRAKTDSIDYNYAIVNSNKKINDQFFRYYEDNCVMARTWSSIDSNNSLQTSEYYPSVAGVTCYPETTAAFGFRPWAGQSAGSLSPNSRGVIHYDPHVSNAVAGMVVGEAARDSVGVVYAWYNGDHATNNSRSTGMGIRNWSQTDIEYANPVSGGAVQIGRFGAYVRNTVANTNTNAGTDAWIAGITANAGYGFRGVLNEVIVFNRKLNDTERYSLYAYLSRKYRLNTKLPLSYTGTRNSSAAYGTAYWTIAHHPNTKGLQNIPVSSEFASIRLIDFFDMYDTRYQSKGSRLADGTTLANDTYTG